MQPPTPTPTSDGPGSAKKRAQQLTPRKRAKKAQPSFVTSLSFPRPAPVAVAAPDSTAAGELKRGMRQSKVDALSKLDKSMANTKEIEREREKIGQLLNGGATNLFPSNFASGSASSATTASEPGPARNPLLKKLAKEKLPQYDLSQVKTEHDYPRALPTRTQPRMFDLEECPVFYPTHEEFKDPMKYMDWVGNEGRGKAYGIAKIVPPQGWKMPFELDTENFRFKTRLQRLNSLEASSRAKVNFLDQLYMFHKQQGDAKVTIPIIAHKTLDLWQLRKEVNKRGGLAAVTSWREIATVLGYDEHLGIHIKMAYDKIILPFDQFSARARSVSGSPLTPMTTPGSARMGGRMGTITPQASALNKMAHARLPISGQHTDALLPPPDLSPSKKRRISGFEGSESELSEAEESPNGGRKKKPTRANGTATKGEECEVCHSGEDGTRILLCDGCDQGYHIYCLEPPLPAVPTHEQWYCTACLFGTGNDYGFDEGEEHTLQSFTDRDRAFKEAWEDTHPEYNAPDGQQAPYAGEQAVEREFWRLVESPHETVEVEYGADVHSTTHGSGAPTLETHPLEEYSADPWNLNNLPILPDSLLRYIKSDVSGMTVPWIYIGMMFSAFCWHNEDHHTYSINYMFWGETKTWYGIPGSDAAKFEDAMKSEAPELFEQQPSLLYQLVTMMNPGRVKQAGVNVVACDQRPNEFVLTFPKAYHCGFNHGLNFNEAVNFALPDWLPDGADCVQRYEEHAKQPVFSHDELLMTITEHSDTIKTAIWIESSLRTMVVSELRRRQQVRAASPGIKPKLVEEDVPEEQYQCCACKSFCYLSQITCACTSQVACLSHADQLCRCAPSSHVLRMRFSDAFLDDLIVNISNRAAQPEIWRERLHRILDESPRPPLKSLRALLADGEKIFYPLAELPNLRVFVERGNAWVEAAVQLMARKVTARRKPKKGRRSEIESVAQPEHEEDDKNIIERTPEAVTALLDQAERLGFETPEIPQLRALSLSIRDFQAQADDILTQVESDCDFTHVESVFIIGNALNVDLPQLTPLGMIVKRLRWKHDLEEDVDDTRLELDDVDRFIAEADEIGIDPRNDLLDLLKIRKQTGQRWKEAAEQCLAAPVQTLDDYTQLLKVEAGTPTVEDLMRQLEANKKQALSWQTTARAILDSRNSTTSKGIADIRKLIKAVSGPATHIAITEVDTLRAELDLHVNWTEAAVELLRCPPTKVPAVIADIVAAAEDRMQPADDLPFGSAFVKSSAVEPITKDTFSCYCRTASVKTMAVCGTCKGSYHPRCIGVAPRSIQKDGFTYTCHMCEAKAPFTEDEYNRASLHALVKLADGRNWAFAFPPQELTSLESFAKAAIRFACHLLTTFDPGSDSSQARSLLLLQHCIRKLHSFPVVFDTVNVRTGERLIFEEWLLKNLDGAVIQPVTDKRPRVRARRPKFRFINDRDKQTEVGMVRCICGIHANVEWNDETLIKCAKCPATYHRSCVHAVEVDASVNKYKCVACHARAGTKYPLCSLRVQATEDLGTDLCVDTKKTLINFYEIVKVSVPHFEDDKSKSVVLEMTEFIPGEKPEDRPDFVPGAATPSEASASAPKKPRVKKAATVKIKEEMNAPASRNVIPTPPATVISAPSTSSSSSTPLARVTPVAGPSAPPEAQSDPKPLTFVQRERPSTYTLHSSSFINKYDTAGRASSSRALSPERREASARPTPTPAPSNGYGSASASPYQSARPAPAPTRYEPVHRDSWTPRQQAYSPDAQSRSNSSRYSPSWSQAALPTDSAQRPSGLAAPNRKRSLSPQPEVRRQSLYNPALSYRPGAASPRRRSPSPSPLPTPLTFGPPKTSESVREAASLLLAASPSLAPLVEARSAQLSQSPRPQHAAAATPVPSIPLPSPSDRLIPGLPAARPPSVERPAAVRLDRWVG